VTVAEFQPTPGQDATEVPIRVLVVQEDERPASRIRDEEWVMTFPHLMVREAVAFVVLMIILVGISLVFDAPLEELANYEKTPNPSKAPWYFLGLQELLSYYDPQIAGVVIPGIIGLVGFMAIPYVDRNPSAKPADLKFAIMLFTFFLAGSATLTMIGTLFRGPGFNFTYPWADGIWFDDLKDWVNFE